MHEERQQLFTQYTKPVLAETLQYSALYSLAKSIAYSSIFSKSLSF